MTHFVRIKKRNNYATLRIPNFYLYLHPKIILGKVMYKDNFIESKGLVTKNSNNVDVVLL